MFVGRQHLLLILGVCVHFLLLLSIFDVYYQSPLIVGLTPQRPNAGPPPAQRIVLFVADGLRAHSFYDAAGRTDGATPFLRKIISNGAAWGVSRTHVPTESRPGHVAMIAGFYEDVSAVTKGWKENPVEFDSVFNESRHTWAWGSPDILPMFAKDIADSHVRTFTYTSDFEDFASSDTSKLDTWVFDRVQEFVAAAQSNQTLRTLLREGSSVLFLHLLGMDTAGHGYKPHSTEYMENIAVVDDGVKNTTELIKKFYDYDGRTTFIFTADHGMTDWGSHGAGSDHETLTPVVAWGAGIKPCNTRDPNVWNTSADIVNVDQVDLAPLMSSLIGAAIPMNSVGRLRLAHLAAPPRYRFHAAHANFRQMLAQLEAKRQQKLTQTLHGLFREFPEMTSNKIKSIENQIWHLVGQKRFEAAAHLCTEWVPTLTRGLLYYHRYERNFLGFIIGLIFLSWILLLICVLKYRKAMEKPIFIVRKEWLFALAAAFLIPFIQSFAWIRILYCVTPVYLLSVSYNIIHGKLPNLVPMVTKLLLVVALVSALVLTFFWRPTISVILMALALWPYFESKLKPHTSLRWIWCCLCLLNALFPLFPPVGQEFVPFLHVIIPFSMACLLLTYLLLENVRFKNGTLFLNNGDGSLAFGLTLALFVSVFVLAYTQHSISTKSGVPLLCQLWSWSVLICTPLVPFLTDRQLETRIYAWALALYVPYTLMSTSHESTFYPAFSSLLYCWLKLEAVLDSGVSSLSTYRFAESAIKSRSVGWNDCRQGALLLCFVLLAFFGTGNMASLSSFNPSFTRCFTTMFQPFLMGALLFYKILVPFLLVAIGLCALEAVTCRSAKDLMLILLIFSDSMALAFFFLLRDSGSWLDIGTSISHYVICLLMTVFVLLLHQIAAVITCLHWTDIFADRKAHLL